MVKELSMVSSTALMPTLRISNERSSRVEIIFVACPGIRGDTVFKRRFGPENFTSTSAIEDLEFATSSLTLSLMEEVDDEEGEGSSEVVAMVGER
jgi:hypothetical protein